MNKTSLIFLSGGQGTRMGETTPKQFLLLGHQPMALHSFQTLTSQAEIDEIIVVVEDAYQFLFQKVAKQTLRFAIPGKTRQESVEHGLLATSENTTFVCIHDSARPFVRKEDCDTLFEVAYREGAAALASPVTSTIKEANEKGCVSKTLSRSHLWQVQTPQVVRKDWLIQAYAFAKKKSLFATDDLSLLESIGFPTYLVPGSDRNIKITTPFDYQIAKAQCALK